MTTPNPEHRGRAEITNEPNNLFIINKNPRIEHTNMTDFALLLPDFLPFQPQSAPPHPPQNPSVGSHTVPLTPPYPPFQLQMRHWMKTYFFQSFKRARWPKLGKLHAYEHSHYRT